ncbi:MAG: response regulator transcription factor [Myxococcales bacterium]
MVAAGAIDQIAGMSAPRPPKILVVDDDHHTRRAIGRLIKFDFPSAVVADAAEAKTALRMIAAELWDLVICDMSMPEMSGLEALRDMRLRNERVPVVIVSCLAADDYEAAAVAAGACAYVEKDRLPDELPALVNRFVTALQVGRRP